MKFWVARDFDGFLNLYVNKPSLDSNDNMYYTDSDMEDDYINREKGNKRGKETLEEFCRSANLPFVKYYELG